MNQSFTGFSGVFLCLILFDRKLVTSTEFRKSNLMQTDVNALNTFLILC